jgi:hypothetical protein
MTCETGSSDRGDTPDAPGAVDRAAPPVLEDLRAVGGGARRVIDWADLERLPLDEPGRRVVGASWRERMKQEHLAVGAFSLLARELAEEGCDTVVLSLVTRAASDEVRHAETCRRYAAALLGANEVPVRLRGVPRVPMHREASPADRVLLHVVEMCCLSETLTGVYLTEMLGRTSHAAVRTLIESLLEDEIDHGRVGWAYLAERAQERRVAALAPALPAMLERIFRGVLDASANATRPDDDALSVAGYVGRRASAEVYRNTLLDVIVPGFASLGVDLGPAREWMQARAGL